MKSFPNDFAQQKWRGGGGGGGGRRSLRCVCRNQYKTTKAWGWGGGGRRGKGGGEEGRRGRCAVFAATSTKLTAAAVNVINLMNRIAGWVLDLQRFCH